MMETTAIEWKELFDRLNKEGAVNKLFLENPKNKGITEHLVNIYPENAHFIYELLQNAEDVAAKNCWLSLYEDRLEFSHDGSPFTPENVDAITAIGFTTKGEETGKIGKFGVGFKSVFAYTNSPHITSGLISFTIAGLVVPQLTIVNPTNEPITCFVFPFNNPKKPREKAFLEIRKGLDELDSKCILFLNNIQKIEIKVHAAPLKKIRRETPTNNWVKILDEKLNENTWLCFQKKVGWEAVSKVKELTVSIAYSYDGKQLIPVPNGGQVFIYFPCINEKSNLSFHINAPFSTTPTRDIISQKEEHIGYNNALMDAIAELVGDSLLDIKKRGLLTVDFLTLLPTGKQNGIYSPIRERVLRQFKIHKLLPMEDGSFATAENAYRGDDTIVELLDDNKLADFLNITKPRKNLYPPLWVKTKEGTANFFNDLKIELWTIKDMVLQLSKEDCSIFLKEQTSEWHTIFYATLWVEYSNLKQGSLSSIVPIQSLRIIRVKDGNYAQAGDCYLPNKDLKKDHNLLLIDQAYHTNGKEDVVKQATDFLIKAGVKEIGGREKLLMYLNELYPIGEDMEIKGKIEDMKLFLDFYREDKKNAVDIFKDRPIFLNLYNKWAYGDTIYIDSPFEMTGLSTFYDKILNCGYYPLNPQYVDIVINIESLIRFVVDLGAKKSIQVTKFTCLENANYTDWIQNSWQKVDEVEIDEDFSIILLDQILKTNPRDKNLSLLIWNTMNNHDDKKYLTACLKPKNRPKEMKRDSTLVNCLRKYSWIPQDKGHLLSFVRPFEAKYELLPIGFNYNKNSKWLDKVDFGQKALQDGDETLNPQYNQHKKLYLERLGVNNEAEIEEGLELYKLLNDSGKTKKDIEELLFKSNVKPIFPTSNSTNQTRREEKTKAQYEEATHKVYETKPRSVRTSASAVSPSSPLKTLYTNQNGQMVCQLCGYEMPFKKMDGEYYFEAVEVLTKEFLPKEFESQYLALCPECAARYKEYVKNDEKKMQHLKIELLKEGNDPIVLELGDKRFELRFVGKHRSDLKVVLQG